MILGRMSEASPKEVQDLIIYYRGRRTVATTASVVYGRHYAPLLIIKKELLISCSI